MTGVEAVEALLAEHANCFYLSTVLPVAGDPEMRQWSCGTLGPASHRAHVASLLAALLQEARREGAVAAAERIRATFLNPDRKRPAAKGAAFSTDFATDWEWAEQLALATYPSTDQGSKP